VVSRRVVVSEKADTHAWPLNQSSDVKLTLVVEVSKSCPLILTENCSHTFTFHYKLQGATNIHCDEVLTCAPWHLPVQKLVLYYPRPLTDFCTYALPILTVCNSVRTSVTTVLMSMAIASILKVFFMTK
jgi:hypothetical protein